MGVDDGFCSTTGVHNKLTRDFICDETLHLALSSSNREVRLRKQQGSFCERLMGKD